MRALVYLALLGLALSAALSGQLALALALGGAKALLVGAEFMELRRADRRHALGFALMIVALVLVLITLGSSTG
ncbi:MAG: hypothetical protein M3Y87_12265 [Myxococcota bacterium]|nr:hypothetical protein [Myxococcota bacterium]